MNKSLKVWWGIQAARVDALSLRERGFMFVSVIALALALADTLLLSPAQMEHKQITQRFATQSTEANRLREELKSTGQPVDASKLLRDEIAEMDTRIQGINHEITVLAPMAEGGPALEQVLVQFLRRYEGLTLVSVGTLNQETAGTSTTVNTTGLSKRGLDLRVSGPYADLVRYVKTLENALPVLRWGTLQLKSEKQPPELRLQVYVLGVQP